MIEFCDTIEIDELPVEIEVEATDWQRAEPDVGIMCSYPECVIAKRLDNGTIVELSDDDRERLEMKAIEIYEEW